MGGWGARHDGGTGTSQQMEDAHKALDTLGIDKGYLALRVLVAVGMLDRLRQQIRTDEIALTFEEASRINRLRSARWHGTGSEPWSGADWSNAMQGEAGEAGNVVKKLRRQETRVQGRADNPVRTELRAQLADEIADTYCYLDLLAGFYGIDMAKAISSKFNRVSEREGFPERLHA